MTIHIVNRKTRKVEEEIVYGGAFLQLVYRDTFLSRCLCLLFSKLPVASYFFGLWQKSALSKRQIHPFIKKFLVNSEEFEKKEYSTFNDFFVRRLKGGARPIAEDVCVAPADGRYWVYEGICLEQELFVKGKQLSISKLLGSDASRYKGGALLMARLAPPDYHRFHFPIDGVPGKAKRIDGYLFSVNPISLRANLAHITENKRVVVEIETENLGLVSFIAVGATNVGSIHFTYEPNRPYKKGEEMGYFSFGASMVIVLFEPCKITFAEDLFQNTEAGYETLCQMGESLLTIPPLASITSLMPCF